MELIQLKMPPDKAQLVAEAIARDIKTNQNTEETIELQKILVWLLYRVQRYRNNHPATPVT